MKKSKIIKKMAAFGCHFIKNFFLKKCLVNVGPSKMMLARKLRIARLTRFARMARITRFPRIATFARFARIVCI